MFDSLYYQAPEDKVFNEVKEVSMNIWGSYDDTYGYASEKIDRIKDLPNYKDNLMYMVSMFDSDNQRKLSLSLSKESKKAIRDRYISGGGGCFNVFI